MGSSTSSTRGGTPFFTSPRGSAALSTTPFASLSECPFTESDGPFTSETQHVTHAKTQPPPQHQQQQAPADPPLALPSTTLPVEAQLEHQVGALQSGGLLLLLFSKWRHCCCMLPFLRSSYWFVPSCMTSCQRAHFHLTVRMLVRCCLCMGSGWTCPLDSLVEVWHKRVIWCRVQVHLAAWM